MNLLDLNLVKPDATKIAFALRNNATVIWDYAQQLHLEGERETAANCHAIARELGRMADLMGSMN